MSLICLVLSIHVKLISFISTIFFSLLTYHLIVAFLGFVLINVQHRTDVGFQCMQGCLTVSHPEITILILTYLYIATSHPSERDNVSAAMVDLITLLILKEFQQSGHVLLLSSVTKIVLTSLALCIG